VDGHKIYATLSSTGAHERLQPCKAHVAPAVRDSRGAEAGFAGEGIHIGFVVLGGGGWVDIGLFRVVGFIESVDWVNFLLGGRGGEG
jgi:hypothetical protein